MRIVVYDDDKNFLEFIKDTVAKINTKHGNIFGTPVYFTEKKEVMEYVTANKDQSAVFLLDIMADNVSAGYEIAEHIKDTEPCNLVVYISDFIDDYALNMEQKIISFAFIRKGSPHFFDELSKALLSAHSQLAGQIFLAEEHSNFTPIKYKDIFYFEKIKRDKYTNLVYDGGAVYVRDTLKSIKAKLDGKGVFIYSNKRYIVNIRKITEIDKHDEMLVFVNGDKVPFSPTRKKELLTCISQP